MPGKDFIGYAKLMDKAMRNLVREVLAQTARKGLVGSHHFFVTFDTRAQGVMISEDLRARFPVEMTIVIQHKYWGLKADDDHFEITLTFNKVPEEIVVPFHAVRRFSDPSQEFGFALQAVSPEAPAVALRTVSSGEVKSEMQKDAGAQDKDQKPQLVPDSTSPPASVPPSGKTVVSLDAFRKK
jgi:hypothetical protein